MLEPTEKLPLQSYLCERYGSSTQKLVQEHVRSLHERVRCKNCHIFNMRCRSEGVLLWSLRIRPPVKTREGYRITEQAGKAFLSMCIREMYQGKHELSQKIFSLQVSLQSELFAEDYLKVIRLGYTAAERTHSKAEAGEAHGQ